jgi:hypothetical protein
MSAVVSVHIRPRIALLSRLRSCARQYSSIKTSTIFSPTPDFLSAHLATHPPPADCFTLYTMCTTLPSLPDLLPHLQSLPNSIGSFSHPPLPIASGRAVEPYISLAYFPGAGRLFHTGLTGRRPVEVGRWHRPHPDGIGKEDRKGGQVGDLDGVRDGGLGGWGEAWEADAGHEAEQVDALAGYEWVHCRAIGAAKSRETDPAALRQYWF